jgi:hypothetical protein
VHSPPAGSKEMAQFVKENDEVEQRDNNEDQQGG